MKIQNFEIQELEQASYSTTLFEDFIYRQYKVSSGIFIVRFKPNNDAYIPSHLNKQKLDRYLNGYNFSILNTSVIDSFYIQNIDNNLEFDYNFEKEEVLKYFDGFNINPKFDIKTININIFIETLIKKINSLNYSYSTDLYFNIIQNSEIEIYLDIGDYKYTLSSSLPLNSEEFKKFAKEMNEYFSLIFGSFDKFSELKTYLKTYNPLFKDNNITKYSLRSFITFYNNFDRHKFEKINPPEKYAEQLKKITNKIEHKISNKNIKLQDYQFTIKGIKFSFIGRGTSKYFAFEVPTFETQKYIKNDYNFLSRLLTSMGEFDSLLYRLERMYLQSI